MGRRRLKRRRCAFDRCNGPFEGLEGSVVGGGNSERLLLMAYMVKPAAIAVRASIAGRYLAKEDTAFDGGEAILPRFETIASFIRRWSRVFLGEDSAKISC